MADGRGRGRGEDGGLKGDGWLGVLGAVVDVEEFEGAEDGLATAVGTLTLFAFGGNCWTRNDAERIAMGLFESFGGDRAMWEFEAALRAPQHPTGHVSAYPLVLGLMYRGRKGRRSGEK
jgi:hypothetical protein